MTTQTCEADAFLWEHVKRFSERAPVLHGQDGTGLLDLMALVTEDELDIMHTLDAEVRADVEAAAHLLARHLRAQG